jgi:hypothetical protein
MALPPVLSLCSKPATQIDVALRDSKTVKVNWAFHGVRH